MIKWASAFFLAIAIGGCQKQSPGVITSDYEDSLTDSIRAESCRNTELTNNLLEARNLKSLFECTEWSKKFPEMYKSLVSMDVEAWNYFASPINNKIFNDKDLRDELIELLNELDRLGGLAELGKVINSLSESNFFENLYEIIKCAEDGSRCPGGNHLTQEELLLFFSFFSLNSENLNTLEVVAKGFSSAIGSASLFPESLRKELAKPQFFSTRLELLDQLFIKIGDSNFKDDLEFYNNILKETDDSGEVWLSRIFQKSILAEDFNYLVFYPVDIEKDLWRDFRLLNVAIKSDLVCNPVGDFSGIKIDVSEHMTAFLYDLFNSSQDNFFQKAIQSIGLIKTATQMCNELSGYKGDIHGYLASTQNMKHEIDFVKALTSSSQLLLNDGYYELFRKFQFAHPLGGARELFILENFSDDFFISFLRLVDVLNRGTQGPIYTGHELLSNFDKPFYDSLLEIVKWAQDKTPAQFNGLVKVWQALSKEGKLFFINFFDAHYKNNANISLLIAYYASTLKVANQQMADLLKLFFSRKTLEEEKYMLESLSKVTNTLSAPDLLEDYERFFSRDHILEILKIISRGYVNEEQSVLISDIYIVEPSLRIKLPQVRLSYIRENMTEQCLARMSDPQVTFYSLISIPPVECSSFTEKDPLMKSFFALADFSYFLSDLGGAGLNQDGVLSPVLLNNYVSLFKSISERYKEKEIDGLYLILKNINSFFKDEAIRNNVSKVGQGVSLLSEDNGLIEVASGYFGTDENYGQVKDVFEGIEVIATLFNRFKNGNLNDELGETNFIEDARYRCSNFHEEIGGKSCPSAKEMKTISSRLVGRLIQKNEDVPTALEQILKMVSIDHGLLIPYESEIQRKKIITLEESVQMFYSFTDLNLNTNKVELELQVYPAAIEDFFNNPNWEVSSDQADSELKSVKRAVNTMERVEIVIRDVRFDEQYLGAHYMNSVAKAEDYNGTVESKFSLLKTCVPLKFCGKFMNKTQHGLAKNSRDAFPSLLDANTANGWRHGDYMQALLTSLVSSSPVEAQASSVIKKRILNLSIDIPYLQTKKQLINHNGKILSLLSMVSGFSNMARVVRDRAGRTEEEFRQFIRSKEFVKVSSTFLKNYDPERDSKRIAKLLSTAEKNGFLENFIQYFSESNYQRQRLAENIIFKSVYLLSHIGDGGIRYEKLGLTSFLGVVEVVLDNYEKLSNLIDMKDLENLKDINFILDVSTYELSRPSSPFIKLFNELAKFIKETESSTLVILESFASNEMKLTTLKEAFIGVKNLLNFLVKKDYLMSVVEFLKELRVSDKVKLSGFQNLLKLSGAKRICELENSNGPLVCRNNQQQNEFGRTLIYLTKKKSENLFGVVDYFGRENDDAQLDFFLKIFPSLTFN